MDEGIKRDLYERVGVLEYWVIDPVEAVVTIHRRRDNDTLTVVAAVRQPDTLRTRLLPGFDLALGPSFA